MSRFLRNLPIQRKLAFLAILTSGLALFAAGFAFFVYENRAFHKDLTEEVSMTAKMAALNSSAAISFDDARAAEQVLHAFAANPQIVAAFIYRKDEPVFARYQRNSDSVTLRAPPVEHNLHRFTDDYFELFQDISLDGEIIGTIYIRQDLSALTARLQRYGWTLAGIMAGATLLALLLMQRFQRVITRPIFHLAGVMHEVASQRNYAVRAQRESHDELGQLTDGFNEMLRQIQERDAALEEARSGLEQRVAERTKALQEEIVERHRTERDRDRFITLSHDMLCIGGFDGSFRRVNPAFKQLMGFDEDELLSRPFYEFVHPEDRPLVAHKVEEMRSGKTVANVELRVLRHDGEFMWIAWSATPVPAEGIFYGYGRDISARREADAEMERLNQELIEISRQAGMAEVATNVLHNVGNVLNSVNVACAVVTEKVRQSRLTNVARIADLLRQHRGDLARFFTEDPVGQKLPEFLAKLAERLAMEQNAILEEIRSLGSNIDHIKEIVSVQQTYARNTGGIRETLPVQNLVEDALRMSEGALVRHRVTVVREYSDTPPVCVEKHKVLQILLNLVSNAKYAVSDNGHDLKQLVVRVSREQDHARVSLMDNGIGIPPENLTRIFSHGFTTKKNGHGFGLHSSVLAAKELGGQLSAASDGLGCGATFTLELPIPASKPENKMTHGNTR